MTDPEQSFINELEIFRTEAQAGAQFLYANLAINAILGKNKRALNAVNRTPLFWKINMGALQTSFFIVLGRIFDQNSNHNIDKLLRIAQNNNIGIFSKAALAGRKRRESHDADKWLPEYLKDVYEPTNADFTRLRREVANYRKIYERNYRDIRRKIFAHKEVSEAVDVEKLFSRTNIRELQKVFVFVNALYEALWQLLHNGRAPVLRPMRYSVQSIMRKRKPEWHNQSVQERIVGEIQDFFTILVSSTHQGAQRRRAKRRRAG